MSHYSGHQAPQQVASGRVAFFGISLFATAFLGFYAYLHRRHQHKHFLDRNSESDGRVSSWETRMMQRGKTSSESNSMPDALRASRVEPRNTPLSTPTSTHNSRHRTHAEDSATASASGNGNGNGNGKRDFSQPTAQKGHPDGREGVYTKNPGWREAAHFASGGRAAGTGVGEREQEAATDFVESAKERVKSLFGSSGGK